MFIERKPIKLVQKVKKAVEELLFYTKGFWLVIIGIFSFHTKYFEYKWHSVTGKQAQLTSIMLIMIGISIVWFDGVAYFKKTKKSEPES